MADRSIAVIGAGLAGLSTGCYAQMNGYRAHLFEHHGQPGGVAAAWRRQEYLIDGGIHFLMGIKPDGALSRMYRELGILPTNRILPMELYGAIVDEASGRQVDVTPDLDRFAYDLKIASPADAGAIDALIAAARAMQRHRMEDMGMGTPPDLAGRLGFLKQMWAMRRILKYFGGPYALPIKEYAARNIRDPWVRLVLESIFLPDVAVWFVLMILGILADRDMGLLEGGCLEFTRALERRLLDLGGQVSYHATVEEILVENDRAVGVRLVNGSEHRADAVVAAGDGARTLFRLLGGRYLPDKLARRYRDWKRFRPLVTVSFGVGRAFAGEPWLRLVRLARPIPMVDSTAGMAMIRLFNFSPRFAPPGKTVAQVAFETEWDYWNDLQARDRARYDDEKERAAAEALDRLEAFFPGIAAHVEVTDVSTPYTTWRYTLNDRGSYEGWLPTPEALMTPMPRTLPGLANFVMAGQWVMPGGGVPPCLYSGRHAAQILCHRDRKPFRSSAPVEEPGK